MENRSILLVEDNADDEALTIRALKKSGAPYEVTVVRDGVEAQDYIFCTGAYADRDRSVLPELILLDLKLPKVNGIEVLRRIRTESRTRLIPVVIFSSSNEESDVLECLIIGANSYIRKPVDFSQFSEAVRLIAQYWLLHNHANART